MINKNIFYFLLVFCSFSAFGQKSFSLSEAIDFGVNQSNEIKLKVVATQDASAQIREFKAIGIPKVNGTINFQHYLAVPSQPVADFLTPSIYGVLFDEAVIPKRDLGPPETFKFSLFQPNTLSGGLEATAMLFDGSFLYGVRASKLYEDLVAKDKDITIANLKSNITKAYAAVLIAQENLKVLQSNIENLNKSLSDTKALFANGFAESLDVDRLELSQENLNIELDRVIQMIAISKNLLKFQMNYPLSDEILLTENIDNLLGLVVVNELANDENIDFNKRPEYQLMNLNDGLNDLNYKRTKAGYLPTARAFANVQANLQRQNLFDNTQTGWIPQSAVGLAINIPIYDGGDKSAKLQRIKLTQEKSKLDRENFENSMTLQIKNSQLNLNNNRKFVTSRKKALDVNQKIYDKTLIKFKEGVGSSFEVSQAELSLYMAQSTYINAIYDLLSAKIDMDKALGN